MEPNAQIFSVNSN